ncbi:unnamed protein product, partial [Mesorhabditis spiculigera]
MEDIFMSLECQRVTVIRIRAPPWLARASGVLLVAGVGSYCAYRICTRYLGRRFVWMLMDSGRFDQVPTADLRHLHPSHVEVEELDSDDEGDKNSESEWLSRVSVSRPASEMSLNRLQRVRRSVRANGLLGLQARTPRSGVLRREGASVAGSSRSKRDNSPSIGSECSASLQIVWEDNGQQWDDEFAHDAQTSQAGHPRHPVHSRLLALDAESYGDLCSVFDDVLSMTTREDQIDAQHDWAEADFRENDAEQETPRRRIPSEAMSAIDPSNEVLQKCMTDSKYMYQQVMLGSEFDNSSECGSVISGRSKFSTKNFKKLFPQSNTQGLWNLADSKNCVVPDDTPTSSHDPMTDSGLSSGLRSTEGISQMGKSLFDSAIGGDIFSSEEDLRNADKPENDRERIRSQVVSKVEAGQFSSNMSVASLEWFDDDALREEIDQPNVSALTGPAAVASRVPVGGQEWDFESKSGSSKALSSEPGLIARDIRTSRRPQKSRDTMVFACEKLQLHSRVFKKIQSLYTRQHLRRIGEKCLTTEDFLASFLSSSIYHNLPALNKLTAVSLNKLLATALQRYNVLQRFSDAGQRLEQFCKFVSDTSTPSTSVEENVESLRLILLLHSIELWESDGPDVSWWPAEHPGESVDRLWSHRFDQGLVHLISWVFRCRFEVLENGTRASSPVDEKKPVILRIGDPSHPSLNYLLHQSAFYPLYIVPEQA